jgi:hypothetical protein
MVPPSIWIYTSNFIDIVCLEHDTAKPVPRRILDQKKIPGKNAIRHLMGQFREILDGPSITSESAHD